MDNIIHGHEGVWRVPSIEFDPDAQANVQTEDHAISPGVADHKQKSLGTVLKHIKGSIEQKVKNVGNVLKHLCGEHAKTLKYEMDASALPIPSDNLVEPEPLSLDESVSRTEDVDWTATIPHLGAAETRSLKDPEASHVSSSTLDYSPAAPTDQQFHMLKIFGFVLILSSLIAWVCLRCRDPRRRADCLARREERRNKKLYRRAARQHAVKMWFWNLRMRYRFASSDAITWDEKRSRVIQQENLLEEAATEDIRALRNAHRVVSNVTAAEEGINAFTYDSESSERRRSVSTLPGYGSDASQPPTYDDLDPDFDSIPVADGFQFRRTETEFRSDSSVISTSPRISRDGTNSDFDEKFEPISLERVEPAVRCP